MILSLSLRRAVAAGGTQNHGSRIMLPTPAWGTGMGTREFLRGRFIPVSPFLCPHREFSHCLSIQPGKSRWRAGFKPRSRGRESALVPWHWRRLASAAARFCNRLWHRGFHGGTRMRNQWRWREFSPGGGRKSDRQRLSVLGACLIVGSLFVASRGRSAVTNHERQTISA